MINFPVSPAILRIVDANCNRCREGLRVLEDYARFHENDSALSAELKQLRHDFQNATAMLQSRAVTARDTAGDVGTVITTASEANRESMAAVVTASAKRVGEALRSVEECAKVLQTQRFNQPAKKSQRRGGDADAADEANPPTPEVEVKAAGANAIPTQIEQLRYRFYTIEKSLLLRLTPGRERMRQARLHVLISESLCALPWLTVAELAIEGGAGAIQLREKNLDGGELLLRARQLVDLCRRRHVVAVINDRPDIALLAGAAGVHVGQGDLPLAEVRKLVGRDIIVGVSTHTIEQAEAAWRGGADYIGVGPLFASTTKPQPLAEGPENFPRAAAALPLASVGISGITAANAVAARAAGLSAVAVSAAICSAAAPDEVAASIIAAMNDR